jgi:hypothetical protein
VGGAKPPKFPTKLSNFRQTPPFALEKAVFSPLSGQNFRKFVIFREWGGGGGRTPVPPRFPPLALWDKRTSSNFAQILSYKPISEMPDKKLVFIRTID